jgi:transketolase
MRNAFAAEITELAIHDPRIVLLSGDIGNRLFDRLKEQCPGRFFNCGVAEANMIGVAAGMGLCGLRPVAYTIAPFLTARCLEQIRLDRCYQRVPVVLVATGAGLSYASLNATHHSCEDIAWLRVLPNMTVLCPGDPVEVRLALRAAMQHDGPVYVRIGKKGEPVVHERRAGFRDGALDSAANRRRCSDSQHRKRPAAGDRHCGFPDAKRHPLRGRQLPIGETAG